MTHNNAKYMRLIKGAEDNDIFYVSDGCIQSLFNQIILKQAIRLQYEVLF